MPGPVGAGRGERLGRPGDRIRDRFRPGRDGRSPQGACNRFLEAGRGFVRREAALKRTEPVQAESDRCQQAETAEDS